MIVIVDLAHSRVLAEQLRLTEPPQQRLSPSFSASSSTPIPPSKTRVSFSTFSSRFLLEATIPISSRFLMSQFGLLKFLGRISYYVIELPFLRLQRMRSRLPQESPSPQLVAP